MKILTLDFDGVIADSQLECLFVGFNNYLRFNKNTKLFDGQKITFDNFYKIKRKYKKIINEYKKLRPYVIDAFCFYVILYVLDNNIKIKNENQYNRIRKKLMNGFYNKCVKNFYNERKRLQREDFKKWLQIEIPFKEIIESIKKLENKYIITVATNNRKFVVEKFLKQYNIAPKIITDSAFSIDKKKQLKHIANKLKAKFNDIHFVDDQIKHFPGMLKSGVNCYLALWGYNNEKQRKEAKELGVVMLNENNFYKKLA